MGAVLLGEYLLLKRVSAWLVSGFQMGLGIAVPREIAHCTDDLEGHARRYFVAAFIFVIAFICLASSLGLLQSATVSRLFLGVDNRAMLLALMALLLGTCSYATVFAYYRGLQRMQVANLVQILCSGVVPVAAILILRSRPSAASIMGLTGMANFAISLCWAFPIIWRVSGLTLPILVQSMLNLLSYGVRRVPGDLAGAGLFAISPVIAAHYVAADQVGFLLVGTTCLTAASLAFAPLGVVLLTKVSRLFGAGRDGDVRHYVGHLRSAVAQTSLLITVQGLIFAKPVMQWWLGKAGEGGLQVMCITMLGIPAYMYFVAMRSVLDAKTKTAYNARNVIVAFAVFSLLSGVIVAGVPRNLMIVALSLASVITVYVLAVLTEIRLRQIQLGAFPVSWQILSLVLVTGFVSLAVQLASGFHASKAGFLLAMAVNLTISAWMLRKRPPEWMTAIMRVGLRVE